MQFPSVDIPRLPLWPGPGGDQFAAASAAPVLFAGLGTGWVWVGPHQAHQPGAIRHLQPRHCVWKRLSRSHLNTKSPFSGSTPFTINIYDWQMGEIFKYILKV